jgi:hypothetical protein
MIQRNRGAAKLWPIANQQRSGANLTEFGSRKQQISLQSTFSIDFFCPYLVKDSDLSDNR